MFSGKNTSPTDNAQPQFNKLLSESEQHLCASLIDNNEEAFCIVNLQRLRNRVEQWKKYFPKVQAYYAVKANPDVRILQELHKNGINFDCASLGEIKLAMDTLQCDPSSIIFANPVKPKAAVQFAKQSNVKRLTFDNAYELYKIKELFPDAELLIRLKQDDSKAVCELSSKFGASFAAIPALINLALELELNVVGMSYNVGSGCCDLATFSNAVVVARKAWEQCVQLGAKFTILDIGGGYSGEDITDFIDDSAPFAEIAAIVNKKLEEHFGNDVTFIAEPGRFFAAPSTTIVANVIGKRKVSTETGTKFMYYINDGLYGSFNNLIYDHATVTVNLLQESNATTKKFGSTVFGPTCDGLDVLVEDVPIPELHIGDWVFFQNMGAYTTCAGSTFNGIPKPKTHYVT